MTRTGEIDYERTLDEYPCSTASDGIQILPATLDHVLALESLPAPHKDPFDRLLIAQANVEGAVLLSADAIFAQYPVNVLW